MIEFTADAAARSRIEARADRFNRKAEKLGLAVRATPTFSAVYTKVVKEEGFEVAYSLIDVTIPEVEIRLPGGFRFVAVTDHLPEGNFIARSPFAGEVEIPESFRTTAATCDHCQLVRNRTHTIIVLSDSGEFKQVGGQCSQAYLGIPASTLVAFNAALEGLKDEEWDGNGGGEYGWSLMHFLSTTAAAIKLYGWTSSKAAYDFGYTSTASVVKELASRPGKTTRDEFPEFFRLTRDEQVAFDAEAEAAVEWLSEQDQSSDYIWNLTVAVKNGFVNGKRAGIVASLIAVYQRDMGVRAEREATAKLPASEFVGQVGDKIVATGKIVFTTYLYSDFGTNVLAIFVNQSTGETFQIKTGTTTKVGEFLDDADKGTEITVKGTVKEHRTDKQGRKSTALTRAALAC